MKKLANPLPVIEVENEGLFALLGKNVIVYATNYIYAGKLVGVNTTCIQLENAGIVYETGAHTDKKFKDFQLLNNSCHYVQCGAIESFGETKKI